MKRVFEFCLLIILGSLMFQCDGKKDKPAPKGDAGGGVPCPPDGEVACIDCKCDKATGFNACTPTTCPDPVKKKSDVKKRDKANKCPSGDSFKAECSLCECGGEGADHCAMCFALPVRRPGQPEDVNKALPWVQDNRFFNYEVSGWAKMKDGD